MVVWDWGGLAKVGYVRTSDSHLLVSGYIPDGAYRTAFISSPQTVTCERGDLNCGYSSSLVFANNFGYPLYDSVIWTNNHNNNHDNVQFYGFDSQLTNDSSTTTAVIQPDATLINTWVTVSAPVSIGSHWFSLYATGRPCDNVANCSYQSGGQFQVNIIVQDTIDPTASVSYLPESPTNQNVVATLHPSEDVTITNNGGASQYTFTQNGTFEFTFEDVAGNTGSAIATVNWIDKVAPTAEVSYSVSSPTNQNVVVTLHPSKDVTITNNGGASQYTFTQNGAFEFTFEDVVGNTGSATATVNWIDKIAPTAEVIYSVSNPTNQNVVATLVNMSESVTVTSAGGNSRTFTQNGIHTFTFQDAAGNTGSATATVNWIDKVTPTATIQYAPDKATSKPVKATLIPSESVTVTNNKGSKSYIFDANGKFTFEFVDIAGNTGKATASVNWIHPTVHPSGTLVKTSKSPLVYLLEGNKLRSFASAGVFFSHRYQFDQIITITEEERKVYQIGQPVGLRSGSLVKGTSPTVYLIDEKGKRYTFPNADVYLNRGYSWEQILTVPDMELKLYPDGGVLGSDTKARVVKTEGDARVYRVVNNVKQPFVTPETFLGMGFRWNQIEVVSASELGGYAVGSVLHLIHPSGTLVKTPGNPMVYYLDQNGNKIVKRSFPNPESFFSYGFDWDQIVIIRNEELASYAVGSVMIVRDGQVVKSPHHPAVYVIEHGKRRHVPSAGRYLDLGYRWDMIKVVPDSLVNSMPVSSQL